MTWFAVYTIATGELFSTGQSVASDADLIAKGMAKVDLGNENPQTNTKQWNKATHVFDTVVPPKPKITLKEFWERFTLAERETLNEVANGLLGPPAHRTKFSTFEGTLRTDNAVDLEDQYVIDSVNQMEAVGYIGAGRAAQVLA